MSSGDEFCYVEWVDASGQEATWIDRSESLKNSGVSTIRSAGIILTEDDDHVTLVQNIDERFDNVGPTMSIPKSAIIKRRRLRASRV